VQACSNAAIIDSNFVPMVLQVAKASATASSNLLILEGVLIVVGVSKDWNRGGGSWLMRTNTVLLQGLCLLLTRVSSNLAETGDMGLRIETQECGSGVEYEGYDGRYIIVFYRVWAGNDGKVDFRERRRRSR